MMPMPPTTSEIAAVAASKRPSVCAAALRACRNSAKLRMMKLFVLVRADATPFAQHALDVGLHVGDAVVVVDLHQQRADLVRGTEATGQARASGGDRHQHGVVLVLATRLPLLAQHADHGEWGIVDADDRAQRIGAREQFARHRRAQHHHLAAGLCLARIEEPAFHHRPVLHRFILRADALHLCRPVGAAEYHADIGIDAAGSRHHARHAVTHRDQILLRQRRRRAEPATHATDIRRTREDGQLVGAEARDLVLDLLAGAVADGTHHDHRGHADDDAQRSEHAAHHVQAQGDDGGLEIFDDVHGCPSATRRSSTRRPSRTRSSRSA